MTERSRRARPRATTEACRRSPPARSANQPGGRLQQRLSGAGQSVAGRAVGLDGVGKRQLFIYMC